MECNKDEALRAKELSEAKLIDKDFVGAKKFAQKAEKLFPGLEGLLHLFIVLDVYISSEKKINGESDWYSVLGVEPKADDDTIRKNYRKLAFSLHPDKNKSVGAEGAFKLVSQAWTLLSDKIKRDRYDQIRNPRLVHQKTVTETQKTSTSTNQPTQPMPRPPNPGAFWTSCTRCLMHFQYLTVHLNQKILCSNCHEPFWAVESAPPTSYHAPMRNSQRQNHKHYVNMQQGPSTNSSSSNQVNVQHGSALNTSAVSTNEQLKRQHAVKAGTVRYQALNSGLGSVKGDGIAKKRRVTGQSSMVHASNTYAIGNSGGEKVDVSAHIRLNNTTRELLQSEIRTMLMTKARKEIHMKMNEWAAEKVSKKEASKKEASKKDTSKKEGRKREGEIDDGSKKDAEETIINGMSQTRDVKTLTEDPIVNMDSDKETTAILMSVPDPDFHDFDMDRTERSFGENQVWAAYDEDDGMPRYYAMIHSVVSKRQFKMQISWLNSKSNSELGPINWVASGFPKTSGDFRIGKHEFNSSLNSFSHKVQWTKGRKGIIHIYPRKGDVWALYRNWSPNWNEFTPDDVIHKYDMAIILEDYSEEKGVLLAPLVKVAGFKSVFHQNSDVVEGQLIPREEIFRLSHQVPFYMLTGEEARNVPKGCWELDPAALPLELLQTTTEAKVKTVEGGQGSEEVHLSVNSKKTEVKGIITYARRLRKNANSQGKEIHGTDKVMEEPKGGIA